MHGLTIRREQAGDAPAIYAVHAAAFPTEEEARLVDRLRAAGHASVSLVAEIGESEAADVATTRVVKQIVGHILLSPVVIDGPPDGCHGLGLAPMAVVPAWQRRGVGSALVRAGLAACRGAGCGFVVVLGHPDFYPRFGFARASALGLQNEYGADEAFMVLELPPGALAAEGGLVKYGPEFAVWA
jgi:putative acetyltransferase